MYVECLGVRVIFEKEAEYYSKNFQGEDFSDGDITSIMFDGCKFVSCNFAGAIFDRCNFIDCEFEKCNLSLVKMSYSKLSGVVFRGSKIIGVDWTAVSWSSLLTGSPIQFHESIISSSSFYGLALRDLVLDECVARDVDFRDGDFRNSSFRNTEFSGSIFSETNLSGVNFSGATNFNIDIFRNNIKKAKFDRFEAIGLLSCLEIELVN